MASVGRKKNILYKMEAIGGIGAKDYSENVEKSMKVQTSAVHKHFSRYT